MTRKTRQLLKKIKSWLAPLLESMFQQVIIFILYFFEGFLFNSVFMFEFNVKSNNLHNVNLACEVQPFNDIAAYTTTTLRPRKGEHGKGQALQLETATEQKHCEKEAAEEVYESSEEDEGASLQPESKGDHFTQTKLFIASTWAVINFI